MTSSDAPRPPGGPLRDDQPDGPLQPTDGDAGALPDPAEAGDGKGGGEVALPPIHREPEQSDQAAALQSENAETSLDQPSQ